MLPEKMIEMMQNEGIKQLIQTMMLKQFEDQKRTTLQRYRELNHHVRKGQILFVGSSLMEFFPIAEMQLTKKFDHIIYNRGISATTTTDLLREMDVCIFDLEPSKIFINIGSNDIGSPEGYNKEAFLKNYTEIMDQIKEKLPKCEVFVMAYYPINADEDFGLEQPIRALLFATRTNKNILEANIAIEQLAHNHGFNFINVNEGLSDAKGNLIKEYSVEGLHLWPDAYTVILQNLTKYF